MVVQDAGRAQPCMLLCVAHLGEVCAGELAVVLPDILQAIIEAAEDLVLTTQGIDLVLARAVLVFIQLDLRVEQGQQVEGGPLSPRAMPC